MENVRIQTTARLNVLLTEDRPREPEYWLEQLPRLLSNLGMAAYLARTAGEALTLAAQMPIHAALVDLETPLGDFGRAAATLAAGGRRLPGTATGMGQMPSGLWLLEFLRRLPASPPVVIVHQPATDRRDEDRLLREGLRLGAVSMVPKPAGIEQVLQAFRQVMDRQYRGAWPTNQ